MYTKCIVCNSSYQTVIWNKLPIRKCVSCGLAWREDFDISIDHYKSGIRRLGSQKIQTRLRNCMDRIRTLSKYIDLNNVCDIGCGEGIFLYALQKLGYTHSLGIEPNEMVSDFVREYHLEVHRGTIDDVCDIAGQKDVRIYTMFHLIEHLPDPRVSLTKLVSCMENTDYLVIETPDIDSYIFKVSQYKNDLIYEEHLFYYNQANLKKLLESCGLKVVAQGKRGFDQLHASIRDSLTRLGLLRPAIHKKQNEKIHKTSREESTNTTHELALWRKILQRFLGYVVLYTDRTDYQWIIVRKE